VLLFSLALSAAIHLLSMQLELGPREERAARPLTAKFIKREPRLVKPLELKKRPKPKLRPMRRRTIALKAKVSHRDLSDAPRPLRVLDRLARPRSKVERWVVPGPAELEPQFGASTIEGDKEPKDKIDMSLEMLDIDALDTGKYHAMVIQDPNDKRKIKGFFHLAIVYSVSMRDRQFHNDDVRTHRALVNLIRAMNRYTDIRCDIIGTYTFDSDELFKTPFIYASARFAFQITESEARNLGRYLTSGGFFVADFIPHAAENGSLHWVQIDISNREMFKKALATVGLTFGRDWNFEKLPNSHPIYHCFFDFPNGPPVAGDFLFIRGKTVPFDYLEGIVLDGRLVALVCRKWFTNPWGDWAQPSGYWGITDPERVLQFGVNLIVFALTQEGSITRQVMKYVE